MSQINCSKCSATIYSDNVEVLDIVPEGPDGAALDILVTCPKCGCRLNGFLAVADMIELDELT